MLAAILMDKADYEGAAEQLRDYIEIAAPGPEVDHSKAMLEQLEARQPPPAASRPQ